MKHGRGRTLRDETWKRANTQRYAMKGVNSKRCEMEGADAMKGAKWNEVNTQRYEMRWVNTKGM